MKKNRFLGMVGLGFLRRGSWQQRIMTFYEMFGSYGEKVTVYSPDEVAVVIGMPDSGKTPKGRKVSRIRSELVRAGSLKKVHHGLYSFRVVGGVGLPDDALDVLNKKAPPGINYCRKEQVPFLEAEEKLDRLPLVYVWKIKTQKHQWHDPFPELLDFEEPDTWKFWAEKAPNALSGKEHPLRGIEDMGLRLQVALSGLESGINRNMERNPGWPESIIDPWGWALHALTRLVGREGSWKPWEEERIVALREAAPRKDVGTVRSYAERELERLNEVEQRSADEKIEASKAVETAPQTPQDAPGGPNGSGRGHDGQESVNEAEARLAADLEEQFEVDRLLD